MADQERPLPKPPATPFGRRRQEPERNGQDLIADRMAEAAASGDLDNFLARELPDSDHARSLARMMMGMTGMASPAPSPSPPSGATAPPEGAADSAIPDDVRQAVLSGDVKNVMDALRREHARRSGGAPAAPEEKDPTENGPSLPLEETTLLDALMHVAAENHVTMDWIIMRALKLYLEEYRRTGRL